MSVLIELLAGALGGAVGGTAMTFIRPSRAPRPPRPRRPICTCDHGFGMHDATGRCQDFDHVFANYKDGSYSKPIKCPCVHYDGPPPAFIS